MDFYRRSTFVPVQFVRECQQNNNISIKYFVKVNYDKSVGRNAWFGNERSGRESLPLRPIPDLAVNGMAVLKSVLLVATDHITVSSSYRSEAD